MFLHAHTPLPIPILWRRKKKKNNKHFLPIISLDYISIREELAGSLRIEKGHSCNTPKIAVFFFFQLKLVPQILSSFVFKMKNKKLYLTVEKKREGRK